MRRRDFIKGIVGSAAARPFAARAEQPNSPSIGFLSGASPKTYQRYYSSFREGLTETGFVEGSNLAIETRWGEGQYDRLPAMAADLVKRQVAVIAALGNAATHAAKGATSAIPIVFESGGDPVKLGFVASLNRPATNMTGVSILNTQLETKRLELLAQAAPHTTTIMFVVNPDNATTAIKVQDMSAAAQALGLRLQVRNARRASDFDRIFDEIGRMTNTALAVASDNVFSEEGERLGQLAALHNIPAIAAYRDFAAAGGLMSYGPGIADAHRQVGIYCGRILKGEKPSELPVQQATKVDMVVNLRVSKVLGLSLPLALLGRADEVIE